MNNSIFFKPMSNGTTLTMGESSGVVRSMLDVSFYLRHIAKPGDLLMIDEPELYLHPENQRKFARLFALLTHFGIQVMITTHSDYFIREFNTLIMLHEDKPYLKRIADREGYSEEELLDKDKIRAYVAEPDLSQSRGNGSRYHTFVEADINDDEGIEARSFDKTIIKINEIQDAILWGDGE
ncbi:MAG: AAA family ATPase [Bacteroidetes bacterium]|nr:AAA family ATPase [Bacteroidota bacterium]